MVAPTLKWTTRSLGAIRVESRTDFTDPETKGLVFRVTPAGHKSWALLYNRKGDGRKRRVTLGEFPIIGLADARAKAGELRARVRHGHDPAGEAADYREANTVSDLLDRFLASHPRPEAAWTKECARLFRKDVEPVIGAIKLPDLTRSHVRQVLERMKGRGATISVNRALAALRRAFSWGVVNDLIAINPAAKLQTDIEERTKDRFLTADEIRLFWKGLESARMSEGARIALKLVLCTGQRPGEVCGAKRSEVDLAAGLWLVPPKRAKNRKAHVVPLSELAIMLFEQASVLAGDTDYMFPSRSRSTVASVRIKPMESHALSHAMRGSLEELGLKEQPATPHDLRRTAASHMARLGISDRHVGRVLNHTSELRRTITSQVYIHHDYLPEKKQALAAWNEELRRILEEVLQSR